MPLPSPLRIGPAGWSYPHWNGVVYPKGRRVNALEYLSQFFDTVEINTSFYQDLKPEVTKLWMKQVAGNPRFLFTAKLHQRFTHDRELNRHDIARFKEGLRPLLEEKRFGALLMQFPWSFRFTDENKAFFVALRRAFHEFPLVAEMRHASWSYDEALGVFIDYRVGFCNIDQPEYTSAMPPTAHIATRTCYVRLHGRHPANALGQWKPGTPRGIQHNYLYSAQELEEWGPRIERLNSFGTNVFVITNNDAGGKSVVNALQLAEMFGDERRRAPGELVRLYPEALSRFRQEKIWQQSLFAA
jgi:uncharacterized protein YecE (DUF72 family)